MDLKLIVRKIVHEGLMICPCCQKMFKRRRIWHRDTQYTDDRANYIYCCYDCILEDDECWHEQWQEYYSGQGYPGVRGKYEPRSSNDYVKVKPECLK